jgi:hypothetical protein
MALLFILWIFARNLLYAALQASVIWAVAGAAGAPLKWVELWQILSVLHFIINFPRILRANQFKLFLPIDIGLFILGLWQGFFTGSILTGLIGALIWLTSKWTGYQPDWLILWLGTVSAAVLFCRAQAKRKGLQAWQGKSSASPAESKLSFGEESPNLPQWQREELSRHRQKRASEQKGPSEILWTRTSEGKITTEIGSYWARVEVLLEGKYAFTAYSKASGWVATAGFDYLTERDAMVAAVEFMRDGKDPQARV